MADVRGSPSFSQSWLKLFQLFDSVSGQCSVLCWGVQFQVGVCGGRVRMLAEMHACLIRNNFPNGEQQASGLKLRLNIADTIVLEGSSIVALFYTSLSGVVTRAQSHELGGASLHRRLTQSSPNPDDYAAIAHHTSGVSRLLKPLELEEVVRAWGRGVLPLPPPTKHTAPHAPQPQPQPTTTTTTHGGSEER